MLSDKTQLSSAVIFMQIIICPGIHSADLTRCFIAGLGGALDQAFVVPGDRYPVYSARHILSFLRSQVGDLFDPTPFRRVASVPLLFISFSAGVVGSIGAAHVWQAMGGTVAAFVALDGWGVPLVGSFPLHRLSHDHFTHWSSALLGGGADAFYADPAVPHLELWRSPHQVCGWQIQPHHPRCPTTAAAFIHDLIDRYNPVATHRAIATLP